MGVTNKGETMFKEAMRVALSKLSVTVQLYFPAALKQTLLDQAAEIDRLRYLVDELRSQNKG